MQAVPPQASRASLDLQPRLPLDCLRSCGQHSCLSFAGQAVCSSQYILLQPFNVTLSIVEMVLSVLSPESRVDQPENLTVE